MKRIIREYLTFNKRERNGIFILLSIIILLIAYLTVSHRFIKESTSDFTKFEKEVEFFQGTLAQQTVDPKKHSIEKRSLRAIGEPFNFNPNNLPEADWRRLGLSDRQIRIIRNYEEKGGEFRTKEDVKKIYGISKKLYTLLEPYIQIPIKEEPAAGNNKLKKVFAGACEPLIEINSADSIQLIKLKGIGAFYAKTIIKYRNLLGGFFSKEQLLEVWKFDQEKFDGIKEQLTVDNSKIKKININTCKATELKHPYLKWNMVNAIVNYRDQHGNYKSVEEIKKTDLVDIETFKKIEPYLIIE